MESIDILFIALPARVCLVFCVTIPMPGSKCLGQKRSEEVTACQEAGDRWNSSHRRLSLVRGHGVLGGSTWRHPLEST